MSKLKSGFKTTLALLIVLIPFYPAFLFVGLVKPEMVSHSSSIITTPLIKVDGQEVGVSVAKVEHTFYLLLLAGLGAFGIKFFANLATKFASEPRRNAQNELW